VGLEEVEKYARCSNGVSIPLAGICDWLGQWAETLSPGAKVGVSGA
jgi:hypothetical protein